MDRIAPTKRRGGAWVQLGEEEYQIPPLNLAAVIELQPLIESLSGVTGVPTTEQIGAMTAILHRAIQRNYPDMTADDVAEMLDIANYAAVMSAALGVSGFVRSDAPSGEAQASQSTGTASTSA